MKLAVSVVVFQEEITRKQIDLKGLIELCRSQGIRGIEFRKNLFRIFEKKVDEILELLNREDISSLYATESTLFNRDKDNTGKIIDEIDFTKKLGAKILRVFPGDINLDDFKKVRLNIISSVQRCLDYANSKGITLVVENTQDIKNGRICFIKELMEKFSSPMLRVNIDTGNFICIGEDPAKAVSILSKYIGYVHLKDIRKDLKTKVSYDTYIGGGEIDFPGVMNKLQQTNYEGFLCLEFDGKGHGIEAVRKSVSYLKKICGKGLKI
ncbi:MAG: sugar phosphate isomerase/epimerase family protein [Candidatus Aerophobetes bacterium]|nr:sugar phosphate isomerase/epimerase family protein [Candidatus Aerophobetes bacterium]